MKKLFLILPLAVGIYATQGWAPPPGKSGAAAEPEFDSKKCDLKPKKLTKVQFKDKSGKVHHICTGQAVCGGKTVPVSCKIASQGTPCPVAKKCVEFGEGVGEDDYYFNELFEEEIRVDHLSTGEETDLSKYKITTKKDSFKVNSADELESKLDEIEQDPSLWPFPRLKRKWFKCHCDKNNNLCSEHFVRRRGQARRRSRKYCKDKTGSRKLKTFRCPRGRCP